MSKPTKHNPYLDEPQDFASMDVSDDYEDVVEGEDGEFYYSEKKQKRVQTKDEQLYGIWADDEWDGEDGRHNKKSRTDRDKSNRIAKPMAFVSSGVIQPGQEETKKEEKTEEKDEEMQEEDESTRAARLATERLQARSKQRKKEKGDNSSTRAKNSAPPSTFNPPKLDKDFASFTQHTTGFGLKMLQKFGFAGRLGKNEQGIANPITAKVRPKGMGFGFGDFKETEGEEFARNALEEEKNAKAKEEAKAKETKSAAPDTSASQWKRSKKDKPKTTYKTVDEVLAEQNATEKDNVQVVLDMRGPHVKVTSLDKITTSTTTGWTPTQAQSSLPELQHNVKLLVELTETDIHRLNRELKHAKDTMTNLENERDELETRVIQEETAIRRTEECLAVIEQLQETLKSIASLGNSLSARFDAIAAFIDTIHHHYPHETRIYHLSTYAFTLVTPLFKALFHTWEPLIPSSTTSTEHVLEILQRWKMLLSGETSSRLPITSSSDDLYGRILHELLLPKLQLCISTQWIPRDQQQSHLLTSLLSSLHSILPSDMYHQLIATLILPKLKNAIDIWNPRTDAIPIHTWVEPWSAVIPEEPMRPLYHIIRTKLAIVLQAWHPADTSALTVISPWLRVWSSHDVDQFLTRSIIPKLTSMLATDLVINPKAQVVTPFTQLMSWQPVMPSRMMIHILYEYFFPKWLTALTTWLSSDPDFEEVSKWYLGWKHLFPESLRELPAIKIIFNKSLDLMNHALQGMPLESIMQQIYAILQNELQSRRTTTTTPVGPSPTELARIATEERARVERTRQQQQREREAAEEVDNMSIKEVMSSYATLNHLEFVPNLKRGLQDGKQVYLFGKVSVYTSGQNIYAYDPTTSIWQPISLPELLTRAQNMANK